MPFRKRDDVPIEVEIRDRCSRVRRVAHNERQRLWNRMHAGALQRREEHGRRVGRHGANHTAGHQKTEGVNRVARIGNENDIAGRRNRLRHIGEAFLGAQGGDDLGVGIELHAKTAGVIRRLGAAQPRDAFGG